MLPRMPIGPTKLQALLGKMTPRLINAQRFSASKKVFRPVKSSILRFGAGNLYGPCDFVQGSPAYAATYDTGVVCAVSDCKEDQLWLTEFP